MLKSAPVKVTPSLGEENRELLHDNDKSIKPGALPYRFHPPLNGWESLPEEVRPGFNPDAANIPGDCGSPQDVKPSWYDEELFREGQRVAQRNFLGISFASLMGIFLEYSIAEGMDPLISTERSTSPKAAGRRYLSNVFKFLTWYSWDPFDPKSPAYKSLLGVRRAHERVRRDLAKCTPEERKVKFTIGQGRPVTLLCPAATTVQRIFQSYSTSGLACPAVSKVGPLEGAVSVEWDRLRRPYLAQNEMALTQWSMIGVFALKPELFAAPHLTPRELGALLHTWAVFGYCLGIEDRFNFALGDLDLVLKRAEIVLRLVIIPTMRSMEVQAVRYWEHVMRCIIQGLGSYIQPCPDFMANLVYLSEDILGLDTALSKTLSWHHKLQLWVLRMGMRYLPRYASWCSVGINEVFKYLVRRSEAQEREKLARGWK